LPPAVVGAVHVSPIAEPVICARTAETAGTAAGDVDTVTAGLLRTLSPAALSAVIWKR
jgi:hypothetical protein